MTQPEQPDELTLRYLEASAQDPRRPAGSVREAVRAHVQAVISAGPLNPAPLGVPLAPAANQARWKISMLASVALVGLTGLLVLQFDRGTPEERELVSGPPAGRTSAAPEPTRAPPPAPEATLSLPAPPAPPPPPPAAPEATLPLPVAPALSDRRASTKPPAASPTQAVNQPGNAARNDSDAPTRMRVAPAREAQDAARAVGAASPQVSESALQGEAAPRSPEVAAAPASESAQAFPASKVEQQGSAAPGAARGADPRALAPVPRVPLAARAAGAVEKSDNLGALAPRQSNNAAAPSALRQRAETRSPEDLTHALHEVARKGQVAQLERLLALGARLDAPDQSGRTPLMLAVIHGHVDMVQRLLAAGANPALLDRDNLSALQHGRRLGLERITRLIEAGS